MIHHMKRLIVPLVIMAALATPSVASAAGWKVVKKKSVSGQFAVTATSATINSPHKIAVDLIGGRGSIVWACSKGFSISSSTKTYGPGLHQLANTAGKSSCNVTASIDGSGHLTLEILIAK